MTNEEALQLRVGERIRVGSLVRNQNGNYEEETFKVKMVVHSPDYRSIWVLTTTARSFQPAQIERRW